MAAMCLRFPPTIIATTCALLFAVNTAAHAEQPSPNRDKQSEADAFCRDKPVGTLISLLGNEGYHIRRCAEERLQKLLVEVPDDQPNPVEKACYKAFRESSEPEIRIRALSVLTHYATHLWSPGGFLGLAVSPHATFNDAGDVVTRLRVTKVLKDGPAARAGLQADDLILSMDGNPVSGKQANAGFESHLLRKTPGEKLLLEVDRAGKAVVATAVLGKKSRVKKRDKEGNEIEPDPQKCLMEYLDAKDHQRPESTVGSNRLNHNPSPQEP